MAEDYLDVSGDGEDFFDDFERGPQCPLGWHHFMVADIALNVGKNNDQMKIRSVVIGTTAKDTEQTEFVPMSPSNLMAKKKKARWAIVLGVTTLEHLKAGGVELDWSKGIGKQHVSLVSEDEYEKDGVKKKTIRINWPRDIMTVEDAKAKKLVCGIVDHKDGESKPVSGNENYVPFD